MGGAKGLVRGGGWGCGVGGIGVGPGGPRDDTEGGMVVGATTDADHAFIPAAVTTLLGGVQPFFSDQHGVGSGVGDGRQGDWADITANEEAIQNAGAVVGDTVEGCAVGEAGTGIAVLVAAGVTAIDRG
jgi:hypothetical protein